MNINITSGFAVNLGDTEMGRIGMLPVAEVCRIDTWDTSQQGVAMIRGKAVD